MVEKINISSVFEECSNHNSFPTKYHYIKKINKISEADDILPVIHMAEDRNPLGALLILEKKERKNRDLVESYYEDFLTRRKEEIVEKLQSDYAGNKGKREKKENICVDNLEILFLCMTHLDDTRARELCGEIAKVYGQESGICAQELCKAIDDLEGISWMNHYTRIVRFLYECLGENDHFVKAVEAILKDEQFNLRAADSAFENRAYEHYSFLCQKGLYDTAVYFLNHYDISDTLLGRNLQEEINKMYTYPSSKILSYARWLKREKLDPSYYYEEWERDVRQFNHDPEILSWLDVTMFFYRLNLYKEQGIRQDFDKLLESAPDIQMFDINKIRYLTRISYDSMCIINRIIMSDDDDIFAYLDKIKHLNINTFELAAYSYSSNVKNCNEGEFDYRQIKEILFKRYSVDEAMYIYMNTHLKHAINLEDIIDKLYDMGVDIREAFAKYPLDGIISDVDAKASVRNKIYITPRNVAHDLDYRKVINATQALGSRTRNEVNTIRATLIRTSEAWYSRNKLYAELAMIKDKCTFYLEGYKRGTGIFAYNVSLPQDVYEQRLLERKNDYPEYLLAWLKSIKEEKQFKNWIGKKVYSVSALDQDKRELVAIEILRTAKALLGNPDDLRSFINCLSTIPLEDANEFRYIHSQKGIGFSFSGDNSREYIREVKVTSEQILSSDKLSDKLKYFVFTSTCMKKYYDFERACKFIGSQLFFDLEAAADDPFYEPFYMSLSYTGKKGQNHCFSTKVVLRKHISNIYFSRSEFRYNGKIDDNVLRPGEAFKTILESYDEKENCFYLKGIVTRDYKNKDQFWLKDEEKKTWGESWSRYMRLVIDLKNAASDEPFEKAKEKLLYYKQSTKSEERIESLSGEIAKIFESQMYELTKASRILNALGKSNPFADKNNEFVSLKDSFKEKFEGTYQGFVKAFHKRGGSLDLFCDVYFNSFMRVAVPKETFFGDITSSEDEKKEITERCRDKGYIV